MASVPIVPEAPPRFSTTNCWPKALAELPGPVAGEVVGSAAGSQMERSSSQACWARGSALQQQPGTSKKTGAGTADEFQKCAPSHAASSSRFIFVWTDSMEEVGGRRQRRRL